MAHTFDSGLPDAIRTFVQLGVVGKLARLAHKNGGYVRAIKPWGGVVRSSNDLEGLELLRAELAGQGLAIAVGLGAEHFKQLGKPGFEFMGELEVMLYFYTSHQRGQTTGRTIADSVARADDTKDPGLNIAMEHAMELVAGQNLGAAANALGGGPNQRIKQLRIQTTEELQTEAEHSIWLQTYVVPVSYSLKEYRDINERITEIATRLRNTLENEQAPLPADKTKDSTIDVSVDITTETT